MTRVSCWCCPLKSVGEYARLREARPELWRRILEMEDASPNTFLKDRSAHDMERAFASQMRLDFE